jgi:hypothetical protein
MRSDLLGPCGPADQVSLMRLRRVLADRFDEIPLLEHHLDLLDSRGVLYATHTAGIWENELPEIFFGVVRHVVRTQCQGPAPEPDVEGWLATGRPREENLGAIWDQLHLGRYGTPAGSAVARGDAPDPGVARLDDVLRRWPHIPTFITTYARVEHFIDAAGVTLPPLTA